MKELPRMNIKLDLSSLKYLVFGYKRAQQPDEARRCVRLIEQNGLKV